MLFDLRSAVRALWRRPFYPILAATVLAIGLSASIAVFTYVNGFYQHFPGVDDNRLVRIFGVENEDFYQDLSFLDFEDYATADGLSKALRRPRPTTPRACVWKR